MLEISYNSLEEEYKEIFLDVACIFEGFDKNDAIKALESCGFYATIGLRVLEQKSLITISKHGSLDMHDKIQEMGHYIVRKFEEPNKHSRLWINKEIEDVLVSDQGTNERIKCIRLYTTKLSQEFILEGLGNMKKLRFLKVYHYGADCIDNNWKFDEDRPYIPNALRSLRWDGYPFGSLPKAFQANNLVELKVVHSNIVQLWEGGVTKVLNNLRFLDLSYSKLKNLDLALAPNLETLDLRGCSALVELHLPVECPKLISLKVGGSKLTTLDLRGTPNLENLNLECSDLVELHIPGEHLKLQSISIIDSKLRTFDLRGTPNLKTLFLTNCYHLVEVQAHGGCLEKLVCLVLHGCLRFKSFSFNKKIIEPVEVGCVSKLHLKAESLEICALHIGNNLPNFRFECSYEEHGSSLIGNVEKLISFGPCACTNLESFSQSICGLRCLTKLTLEGSIPESPKDLDRLEYLLELDLLSTKITHLPDNICKLKHLKCLKLDRCWLLEKLPEDLGRLECLEKLILSRCVFLRHIPDSICMMKCLQCFLLPGCILVEKLPEEIGRLRCLKELNIEGTNIRHLPESIFELKGLLIVAFRWLLQSYGFTSHLQTLEDEEDKTLFYIKL